MAKQQKKGKVVRVGGLVCRDGQITIGLSPYEMEFFQAAAEYGGFVSGHGHIDRADITDPRYYEGTGTSSTHAAALTLPQKRDMLGSIHMGKYSDAADMAKRLSHCLGRLCGYGTTKIHTCFDATPDLAEEGLYALNQIRKAADKFSSLEVKCGPHPVWGLFKGERLVTYRRAAEKADFLTGLPEADDHRKGFEVHVRVLLEMAISMNKELHLHVDQTGNPAEKGSQRVINVVKSFLPSSLVVAPDHVLAPADQHPTKPKPNPMVWLIHALSSAALSEKEFRQLVDDLLEYNIGVIVCPSATLSNRQIRSITAPIHNSLVRVLELAAVGVPIRFGFDNVSDYLVPWCTGNMMTELMIAGTALRFASPRVLAKFACGVPLDNFDRGAIKEALRRDYEALRAVNPRWKPAINLA
ncbi:MAG: hypothetical protein JW816_01985 [Candidatus Buchananbacteria bacterium]|nr:hypothetical protein [Candidatus Buchananbacteria bacterium]